MSEIYEFLQICDLVFRLSRDITMTAIKVFTAAYYGQWSGQVDLHRFHKMVGSHTGYLDISTQNPTVLRNVLCMMNRFGILYARLPDLNESDGHTQIAFNADQVEALKAGVNDYNARKLSLLQTAQKKYGTNTEHYQHEKARIEAQMPAIRSMTADDYALTRLDPTGQETPEYRKLQDSAEKAIQKMEAKKSAAEKVTDLSVSEKATALKQSAGRIHYLDALTQGQAQKISMVADMTETYLPTKQGQMEKVFRARFPQGDFSVLLRPEQVLNSRTAVIEKSESLRILNNSGLSSSMSGEQIIKAFSSKVPSLAVQAALAVKKVADKTEDSMKKTAEQTIGQTKDRRR